VSHRHAGDGPKGGRRSLRRTGPWRLATQDPDRWNLVRDSFAAGMAYRIANASPPHVYRSRFDGRCFMVTSPLRETVVEPSRELDDRIVAHSLILCMRGHVGAAGQGA
jgi:hypothetical protein